MKPTKYRFECGCVRPCDQAPAKYLQINKRSYFRVLCPEHHARLLEKIFECQKCGADFPGGPKASYVKFCEACNPRLPVGKNRNINGDAVASVKPKKIKSPVITPTDNPNIPPCARCDHGHQDKSGPVCQACEARVAWANQQDDWWYMAAGDRNGMAGISHRMGAI